MTVQRERGRRNQETRRKHFAQHPLCVVCEQTGRVTLAKELDHIIALDNGGTNEPSNRQGLCIECHKVKTLADMGYSQREERKAIGLDGWPLG